MQHRIVAIIVTKEIIFPEQLTLVMLTMKISYCENSVEPDLRSQQIWSYSVFRSACKYTLIIGILQFNGRSVVDKNSQHDKPPGRIS